MKVFNTIKGIKLLTLIFLVALITTSLSIMFASKLISSIDLVNDATEKRSKSLALAYELKQSSSDLTLFARLYVETKHPRYKYYYNLISDMRNGSVYIGDTNYIKEYKYYGNFYWDVRSTDVWPIDVYYDNWEDTYPLLDSGYRYVYDYDTSNLEFPVRTANKSYVDNKYNVFYNCDTCLSLRERMELLNFEEEEFNLLSESESLSNELSKIEQESFSIIEGNYLEEYDYGDDYLMNILYSDPYNSELVIETSNLTKEANNYYSKYLLFNEDYLKMKADIMIPIAEFRKKVDERTRKDLKGFQDSADSYMFYTVMLSIISLGVLFTLGMVIFITRRKNDLLMFSLNKKNTYLEHAAKILRHDMHSGINVYIPRGVSSLKRRLTDDKIDELKIKAPIDMISEGLAHTRKVYKGVYEFTNLVKKDAVMHREEHNIKDILTEYLSHTSYRSQVIIDDNLPTIVVNDSLFCTAVDNLIRNGLKYNDSDTKIVKVYLENNRICIEDNGRGMSQKDFEYLSQPYARKEGQKEQGMGLGLNICNSILEEHGFKISVEKLEKGTKIRIHI